MEMTQMTRRYADRIAVIRSGGPDGSFPSHFLWRERRYSVREVLAYWTEAGRWWAGAAGPALAERAVAEPALGMVLDDREREFWRVEAVPLALLAPLSGHRPVSGQSASEGPHPGGVYDLCFDESRGRWHLAGVSD